MEEKHPGYPALGDKMGMYQIGPSSSNSEV
jgi:hypothetical protein